jgi:hypothetical protein
VVNWEPVAAAVIPQAVAPAPRPVAAPVYVAPEEVLMPSPSYNFPVATPIAAPWQKPARGAKTYILVAGGVVVLIMVMMVLNSLSVVPFHLFESAATPTARPVATPQPPSTARTDFDRADRFLNQLLTPAIGGLNDSWQPLFATCNGPLSASCLAAIKVTDQAMNKILSVIDHNDVPLCISSGMVKVRKDAVAMEAGLQIALKGFQDNNAAETKAGLSQFGSVARTFGVDMTAVDVAQKTLCDTQEVGP